MLPIISSMPFPPTIMWTVAIASVFPMKIALDRPRRANRHKLLRLLAVPISRWSRLAPSVTAVQTTKHPCASISSKRVLAYASEKSMGGAARGVSRLRFRWIPSVDNVRNSFGALK